MKKTKKVFSVALSMLLAFTPVSGLLSLTACGGNPPPGPGQGDSYDVKFNNNGKPATNMPVDQQVKKGEKATKPQQNPTTIGNFGFAGWYTNQACTGVQFDFNTPITSDITLYAKWEANTSVTVTFMVNDDVYDTKTAEIGGTVTLPENPTDPNGGTFAGWFLEDGTTQLSSTTIISADTTVTAKFVTGDAVTITFVAEHGTAPSQQVIELGSTAKYPIEKPGTNDKFFAGWATDEYGGELFDFSTPLFADTTLHATYKNVAQNDKVEIRMGGYFVDSAQDKTYQKMIEEFNKYYGNYNRITALPSLQSLSDYETSAQTNLNAQGGYDVYMVNDRSFKNWAKTKGEQIRNIGTGTDFTGNAGFDEQLDGMWQGMIDRFRLNVNGWTSYEDDDLWVVPVDSNPTALYYNRSVLEKNGIIVISIEDITITEDNWDDLCKKYKGDSEGNGALADVDKSDALGNTLLDLWNAGEICDLFHNFHYDLKFVEEVVLDQADDIKGIKGYNGEHITSDWLLETDIIPAKGFYRSESPRNSAETNAYIAPEENELLVFNASIAMSWDEMEDVAMICTKSYNGNSASNYGYFTQWWFCYGWSVGGDCVEDMTGEGTWAFSLSDFTANYMVTENACTEINEANPGDPNRYYIGKYTGRLYRPGETLDFLDKIDVEKLVIESDGSSTTATGGDIILPSPDGSFYKYNVATGIGKTIGNSLEQITGETDDSAIRQDITANASKDQNEEGIMFIELPSTKEAFTRFCNLYPGTSEDSVGVSYEFVGGNGGDETVDINKLARGDVAFVIERGDKLGQLRLVSQSSDNKSWGVANVPVFKEYANPNSPNDVTIKRMGNQAGHSECVALGITKGCPDSETDEAWKFIQWMAADYFYLDANGNTYFGTQRQPTDVRYPAGQAVKADNGYIPNQPALFESLDALEDGGDKTSFIKKGEENLNLHLFANAIEYESAGDWWYLPSSAWIDEWANSLNSEQGVRGGVVPVAEWFNSGIINNTNQVLAKEYSYFFDASNVIDQWENHVNVDIPTK